MGAYKVNVSLPEELVSEIDEVASDLGMSRSGFIAEASSRYIADIRNLSAEERRHKEIQRAIAGFRRIRSKLTEQDIQDLIDQMRRDRERGTLEEWQR